MFKKTPYCDNIIITKSSYLWWTLNKLDIDTKSTKLTSNGLGFTNLEEISDKFNPGNDFRYS